MILIGLIGGRKVGKSRLAEHVVQQHGFAKMHPFDGGKAASKAYFIHLGASADEAERMVDGNLKDVPSPYLPHGPGGEHFAPRYFQEKFGAFMGDTLGADWTLHKEVEKLLNAGSNKIISESIVFEIDAFRALGGIVIKIETPMKQSEVVGVETDKVTSRIVPDFTFLNPGSDLHSTQIRFADFLEEIGLLDTAQAYDQDEDCLSIA